MKNKLKVLLVLLFAAQFFLTNCSKFKPTNARETPTNALERAKKNVEEGRGISIGGALNRNKNTTYEFSTSNPLWRASLEALDFLPLSVVDYSGGIIVTDWYGDEINESIKITIRFLSNEIAANSLKIIVHKKNCPINSNCSVNILNSKINNELLTSIVKKAAVLEKQKSKR
jgi:hypothetical protein